MYRLFVAVALMVAARWAAAQGTAPVTPPLPRAVISVGVVRPQVGKLIESATAPAAGQTPLHRQGVVGQVVVASDAGATSATSILVAIALMFGIALRRYSATRQ